MTHFVAFGYVALLFASVALWLLVGRMLVLSKTPLSFETRWQPEQWPRGPIAFTLFYIGLGLFVMLNVATTDGAPPSQKIDVSVSSLLAPILEKLFIWLVLFELLTRCRADRAAVFGMHFKHVGRQVFIGSLTFVASLAPTMLGLLLIMTLKTKENTHMMLRLLQEDGSPMVIFAVILAAVVMAAIAEELMFRVILQDWLCSQMSPRAAILTTAFLFAAVHNYPDAIALMPLSLLLGYLYYRKHSYIANVVAHSLFNGFMITMTLFPS